MVTIKKSFIQQRIVRLNHKLQSVAVSGLACGACVCVERMCVGVLGTALMIMQQKNLQLLHHRQGACKKGEERMQSVTWPL